MDKFFSFGYRTAIDEVTGKKQLKLHIGAPDIHKSITEVKDFDQLIKELEEAKSEFTTLSSAINL